MNLSELIPFLKKLEAKPKKRLSQNFLIDAHIVQKTIELAQIKKGEPVLEIGPGPGALTAALLAEGAEVFAVEIDPLFARELARLQNGHLQIFQQDILKFPFDLLPKEIKIVANLPYHITTPILERIFATSFSSLTVMVQKEVVDRMQATACSKESKEYGSLSVFVQFFSQIHGSFPVSKGCFYPTPRVDSTVIRLNSKELPQIDQDHFFNLVHKGFQQRRKMLTSSLPFPKEEIRRALQVIGVRMDARPENLSIEQWLLLETTLKMGRDL